MARRRSAEESGDQTFEHGGLTEEELAAQTAAEVESTPMRDAVAAAVASVRAETSHLDDLMHRMDKGLPVTREHLGAHKTRLDAAVTELVDAAGLA